MVWKKWHIFRISHESKTNYNQFSIHSLQLLKDEIQPYSIFASMVQSLNEECVLFDDILYI